MRTFGLQTFTIRKEMKSDFEHAIKTIHEIGIKEIEAARMKIDQQAIDVLKKYQMNVISLQMTYHKLMHKKSKIIHFCKEMKTKYVIISVLPLWAHLPLIGFSLFSKRANQLIEVYEKQGLNVAFHHHAYEMKRIKDKLRLDHILKSISPKLGLVIDTYWMTKMNQDPRQIYLKYKKRVIGIHLREYGLNGEHSTIGQGVVQFKELLNILEEDVYTVIEQKTESAYNDIKEGFTYLEEINEPKTV